MGLEKALSQRILILDGAMGTVLQKLPLNPEDFHEAIGCYEILNETRPEIILNIHRQYIEAGADIIETNSFNANAISLKQYHLEKKSYSLSKKAAEIAKQAVKESRKNVYVLGAVGPSHKSLTLSKDKNNSFQELKKAYYNQILGLIDGGVDGILIETIFDILNAKAAVMAAEEVLDFRKKKVWILISATVNKEGKLLTGDSMESLISILDRPSILSFGFNCCFDPKDLEPFIQTIHKVTDKYVSLYPNAGLPNSEGRYTETVEQMIENLFPLIQNQQVNIIGGCCGTSYEHIQALANIVSGKSLKGGYSKEEKEKI